MDAPSRVNQFSTDARDYLRVEQFVQNLVGATALKHAIDLKVIDILNHHPSALEELAFKLDCESLGLRFLLDILVANQVLESHAGVFHLGEEFKSALQYRDLIEAKLEFAKLVTVDFAERFESLILKPHEFMQRAEIFKLFDYGCCFQDTEESYQRAKQWMRYTTVLTKYEAGTCLPLYDFGQHFRMMDIGGNSGEFVLNICRHAPELQATVFDLPVVCRVGLEHVSGEPEQARIRFVAGNALRDPLPSNFDLITFKSMLHDWPEKEAKRFLRSACDSLLPGGTLLIFERSRLQVRQEDLAYSQLPMLLFFRSFRSVDFYQSYLQQLGFEEIHVRTVHLEMPFLFLTARKPR